jgi:predicted Zn-ribbon and HTH transcriptional regulator
MKLFLPLKIKQKKPSVPPAMHNTIRRELIAALGEGVQRSARELSVRIGISEREVYDHLDHVRKSLSTARHALVITPAECRKCGFVFLKRERLRKPGRCPVCRGESISEALFTIEQKFPAD